MIKVLDDVFPLTQLAELARKPGSKANESEESAVMNVIIKCGTPAKAIPELSRESLNSEVV